MEEDRFSIRDMILELGQLIQHVWSKWLKIGLYTMIIAALLITYDLVTKEVFTAETTFIIEKEQSGASDFGKAAASLVGVSLGSLGQSSGLFDTDHIEKLYNSDRMLRKVFLTFTGIGGDSSRLITYFGKVTKQEKDWSEMQGGAFSFEIPEEEFTVTHDSLLMEVFEDFREKQLVIERLDRKLEILSVRVNSTDKLFAKRFNEVLVEEVNQFYLEVKTKKTGENVAVLKKQRDSLKNLLDYNVEFLDSLRRRFPNANPAYTNTSVENSKLIYDLEATGEAYIEITKSYEMAKITHLNNTPIIQLIDEPVLPLKSNKDRLIKTIVLSLIIGGVLSVVYVAMMYIYRQIMNPEHSL